MIADLDPADDGGFGMARRLRALPGPPAGLTSSAEPAQFGAQHNGYSFVAKAGLCAEAIRDTALRGTSCG